MQRYDSRLTKLYFQEIRAHQKDLWNGGGMIEFPANGHKPQRSYGSAAYGLHALAAFESARFLSLRATRELEAD